MSTLCNVCRSRWCGCGGGALCSTCKKRIETINNDPNLTPEQKQEKLAQFYADHKST